MLKLERPCMQIAAIGMGMACVMNNHALHVDLSAYLID